MALILKYLLRAMKYTALILLVLLLVFAVWWLGVRVYRYKVCVELPNGMLIGRVAVFDPKNYLWTPGVTLKLPDGTRMIKDPVHLVYFSKTTVYGTAGPLYRAQDDYHFAYRPDVGFILASKDWSKFEMLKEEAGELLRSTRTHTINLNLLGAYMVFSEEPDYRRTFCPLSIFP